MCDDVPISQWVVNELIGVWVEIDIGHHLVEDHELENDANFDTSPPQRKEGDNRMAEKQGHEGSNDVTAGRQDAAYNNADNKSHDGIKYVVMERIH